MLDEIKTGRRQELKALASFLSEPARAGVDADAEPRHPLRVRHPQPAAPSPTCLAIQGPVLLAPRWRVAVYVWVTDVSTG